jgi:hypothetical protein
LIVHHESYFVWMAFGDTFKNAGDTSVLFLVLAEQFLQAHKSDGSSRRKNRKICLFIFGKTAICKIQWRLVP